MSCSSSLLIMPRTPYWEKGCLSLVPVAEDTVAAWTELENKGAIFKACESSGDSPDWREFLALFLLKRLR